MDFFIALLISLIFSLQSDYKSVVSSGMHGQLQIVVSVIHTWAGYSLQLEKDWNQNHSGESGGHN